MNADTAKWNGWWSEDFSKLAAGETKELLAIRQGAFARFVEQGLPTTSDEEWKYTDITRLATLPFFRSTWNDLKVSSLSELGLAPGFAEAENCLVFVNGYLAPSLSRLSETTFEQFPFSELLNGKESSERELVIGHLQKASAEDAVVALGGALFTDGVVIRVKSGAKAKSPLSVLFVTTPKASGVACYPKVILVAEEGSQCAVIEAYLGLGTNSYLTQSSFYAVLKRNAQVEHYKLQLEGENAYHLSTASIVQERDSAYSGYSLAFGSVLCRNDLKVVLQGEGSNAALLGLSVLKGRQHVDNHTLIEHRQPNAVSWELYKGIYGEQSRGVFTGTIVVEKGAQKTNAIQANHNMLLSSEAHVDTKPQLKINANDVKCTHGATIGQIDEDALYYLQSRGIPASKAKEMLVQAFAGEVIDRIKQPRVKELVAASLEGRLIVS